MTSEKRSTVILLRGPSSSGKSTIARVLLEQLPKPYLHVEADAFVRMFPGAHPALGTDPLTSEYTRNLLSGMRASFAALADSGNNLVLDAVVSDRLALAEMIRALAGHELYLVGVFCSASELERRERERGNRQIGLATAHPSMHAGVPYDIEVDTTVNSAESCSESILEHIDAHPPAGANALVAEACPREPETTPAGSDR